MSICKQKLPSFTGSFLFWVKHLDTDKDVSESEKVSSPQKILGAQKILRYNEDNQKTGGPAMTVTIDPARCIACGMCAYTAPEVFRIVEKSSTVIAQPEKSWYPRVRTAANGCPVNAISIEK